MDILGIICQASIVLNCMSIFFTSSVYKPMFIKAEELSDTEVKVEDDSLLSDSYLNTDLDKVGFFMLIVALEHILMILKLIIEQAIEDVPIEVQRGQRTRGQLIDNFN